MERIKSEIKNLIDEWRWYCSAEAKYRCEVYKELLEYINSLQEEPVSNDLEEAANDYAHDLVHDDVFGTFIAGARWQEEQCQKTIELAEDHAYLAGQEKVIEKACEWLKCNFNMPNDFESHFKKAMEE